MIVSTRGRYALRVMIDLAEHQGDGFIPMKSVAERQGISLKYLEQILPVLKKAGLIEGVHGKGGGYRLCRKPNEYTVLEILELTEGCIAPVACLEPDAGVCEKAASCRTLPLWSELNELLRNFFRNKTIQDLMKA